MLNIRKPINLIAKCYVKFNVRKLRPIYSIINRNSSTKAPLEKLVPSQKLA